MIKFSVRDIREPCSPGAETALRLFHPNREYTFAQVEAAELPDSYKLWMIIEAASRDRKVFAQLRAVAARYAPGRGLATVREIMAEIGAEIVRRYDLKLPRPERKARARRSVWEEIFREFRR